MKHIKRVLVPIVFFGLISCERKELPEPVIEEPDFKMSGTIDGNPFSMVAGENNMQADAHAFQDAFGIYHYASFLEPFNCEDCPGGLSIQLTSDQLYPNGEIPLAEADLYPHDVELLTTQSAQNYMAIEMSTIGLPLGTFLWQLEGGSIIYTEESFAHTFNAPGPQEVVLQLNNFGTCMGSISRTIMAGSPELCSVPFEVLDLGGGVVSCTISELLPEGLTLNGFSVDGVFFPGQQTSIITPLFLVAPHLFEASFTNAQGIQGSYSVIWETESPLTCFNGISWNYVTPAPETGKVAITYQAPNGNNYTSAFSDNANPEAQFQIVEVADYDLEINGLPTRRVRIAFSVFLINTEDPLDIIFMENVQGEMAFVLPD